MTWAPDREPWRDFTNTWRTTLAQWGIADPGQDAILYGTDAWAFSAVIHLQSIIYVGSAATISFRMRLFLLWSAIRSDRRKLCVAEKIAVAITTDQMTNNQARQALIAEGLWPDTLAEAGLVEDIPHEISQIEDDAAFETALAAYRKNKL